MRRLSFLLVPSLQFTHSISPPSSTSLRLLSSSSLISRTFTTKPQLQIDEIVEEEKEDVELHQDFVLDAEVEEESPLLTYDPKPEKEQKFFYSADSVRGRMQQYIEPLKGVQIPEFYENLNFEAEIEPAIIKIRETLKYNNEELKYMLRRNKKSFTSHCSPQAAKRVYLDQLQFPFQKVRSLVLRGPIVLLRNQDFLMDQYRVMRDTLQLSDEEILYYLLEVPELLHWSGTYHILEILDRFELYMGWDEKQVTALFKESPWMLAQTIDKIETLLKLFKGYKFDKQLLYQVVRVFETQLLKDGSIFGMPPSVLRQSIRILRDNFKLKSREILNTLLIKHPQYLMQSKFRALQTKLQLLRQNGCSELMIKRVFQHYPQFYLKSINSFQVKIKYLKKNCQIDLSTNPYFPLCLIFDFRSVIYPRLECLGLAAIQSSDLAEILRPSDEQFCENFEVSMEVLKTKKLEKKEEKDVLWRYVANI